MLKGKASDVDYINICRIKRSETEYDFTGGISESESIEIIEFALEFEGVVLSHLK